MAAPDLPQWATAPSAAVVEPDSTKKAAGWLAEEKPPVGWFNWLLRQTYLCLLYLFTAEGTARFPTKAELVASLSAGEVGSVTFASSPPPFNRIWTYTHAAAITRIVTDGVRVYAATATKLYAHDVETGSLLWSYPASTFVGVVGMACDGEGVFIHDGGVSPTLYQVNAATGATVQAELNPFTSNAGEIAVDGASLYVVQRNTSGPQYSLIHVFDKTSLADAPTSYNCAEIVNAIACVDGRFIAAGIEASVSGYTTGVLDLDAGTFSPSDAIGAPDDGDSIAYDGVRIWVGTGAATAFYGSGRGSRPVLSPDPSSLLRPAARVACNGEFLCRVWSTGGVNFAEINPAPSSARFYTAALDVAAPTIVLYNGGADALNAVAVDEARAFFGGAAQTALAGATLFCYGLTTRPRLFRRLDSTSNTRLAWTGLAYAGA